MGLLWGDEDTATIRHVRTAMFHAEVKLSDINHTSKRALSALYELRDRHKFKEMDVKKFVRVYESEYGSDQVDLLIALYSNPLYRDAAESSTPLTIMAKFGLPYTNDDVLGSLYGGWRGPSIGSTS